MLGIDHHWVAGRPFGLRLGGILSPTLSPTLLIDFSIKSGKVKEECFYRMAYFNGFQEGVVNSSKSIPPGS
jgi:hypothetical protein